MCKLIRSMSGFGPVTNPRRIPELRTLEKESNLKTRPSVSIERKLVGRLAPNYKGIEFKLLLLNERTVSQGGLRHWKCIGPKHTLTGKGKTQLDHS